MGNKTKNSEIAFFGGSFTAVERDYMVSLLKAANKYLDSFYGIRISTRPDFIDEDVLDILKSYGVTSIELGAQSMVDSILQKNLRGHSARDVENASKLIKNFGFSLGLQMMTGLYTADYNKDIYTARKFVEINPDTVRIYPTVIIENTMLSRLYREGVYKTYTLSESVKLCAVLLKMFENRGIKVIRLGLHYSESLLKSIVYDNYHPAFRELCENEIFKQELTNTLKSGFSKDITVFTAPCSKSKLIGQHRCNIKYLISLGYSVKIEEDESLGKYQVRIENT